MAKTKISQYDATAANNTDIDSISIAEGMAPSNVNNAIRELMAHLKDMDAGTQALTSPQLSSVDINGGTIDGAVIGANSAAAITGTTITGTSLVIGDANINENDFESIDGITAGTVAASKAVIVDANKDVTGFRNVTLTGELDAGSLDVSGDLDVDGTTNLDVVDVDGLLTASAAIEINGAAGAGISEGMLIDWSTNLARFLTYDSSSGSEIAFFTQPSGGSTAERVRIKDDGGFVVTPVAGGHAVFNEGSIDADFRVESNGSANALFVDGGNNHVNIMTSTDLGAVLNVSGNAYIQHADNSDTLTLECTDADTNSGPNLRLYRNSANPVQNDLLGNIQWEGRNNNSQDVIFAEMRSQIETTTDGSEDANFKWSTMVGGTLRDRLSLNANATVFNDDSIDVDFRVESNGNANMLFVDGGNDAVGIGTTSPNALLHVGGTAETQGSQANPAIQIGSTTGYRLGMYTDAEGGYIENKNGDNGIIFKVKTAGEAMRIDGGTGNVGIGDTSPYTWSSVQPSLNLRGTSSSFPNRSGALIFKSQAGTHMTVMDFETGNDLRWYQSSNSGSSWSERMRLDSSGNLLVGKTAVDFGTQGIVLKNSGSLDITKSGDGCMFLNRLSTDGGIAYFYKDGSAVGNIGVTNGSLGIGQGDTGLGFFATDNIVYPSTGVGLTRDNAIDLGYGSGRFDDIYATNATIQTSDQTEKQDIAALTSTEMLVGKRISALFKTFRWKDKVASKGDNARTHTGIIAQDVQAAFTAEGLDAGDYSLFISSTWLVDSEGNEVEEGTEGAVSKTRMGIRYPELLSFVAAYNEQRFANIETRLTALEG